MTVLAHHDRRLHPYGFASMFGQNTHMVRNESPFTPRDGNALPPRTVCVEKPNQIQNAAPHSEMLCHDSVSKTRLNSGAVGTGINRMRCGWGHHKNDDTNTHYRMGWPIHDPVHPPTCPLHCGASRRVERKEQIAVHNVRLRTVTCPTPAQTHLATQSGGGGLLPPPAQRSV